jgi:hypothetical protein
MFISLQQIPLESADFCEALGKMVRSGCERALGGLPRGVGGDARRELPHRGK